MADTTRTVIEVGKYGVIKDIPDYMLDPSAWTDTTHMRPEGLRMVTLPPDDVVTMATNTEPTALMPIRAGNIDYVFAGCVNDAYILEDDTTFYNVSGTGFASGSLDDHWTGGFGTVPIFNLSGFDYNPQSWNLNTGSNLTALANWPANYKCNVLRPYRNFWLAGDIEDSGSRYPQLLHWSNAAAAGALPDSWDTTDTTRFSRKIDLADAEGGKIVDILVMGRTAYVYKDASMWSVRLIGGVDVMQVDPFSQEIGLHAPNHAVQFMKGQAFTVGTNGVQVHDTNGGITRPLHRRMQRWLDNNISPTYYKRGFVVSNTSDNEVMYFYPDDDTTSLTYKALVWNYRDDTVYIRDVHEEAVAFTPGTRAALVTNWQSDNAEPTYADLSMTIDEMDFPIASAGASTYRKSLITFANDRLHVAASGLTQFTRDTKLERTGQLLEVPPEIDVYVTNVEIHGEGVTGETLTCQLGWQAELGGPVVWTEQNTITFGGRNDMDFKSFGKIPCFRFTSSSSWQMRAYAVSHTIGGRHRYG